MHLKAERGFPEKSFMSDNVFIDTNLLLYAASHTGSPKEDFARKWLVDTIDQHDVWISTQVMMEFSANLIKKAKVSPTAVQARLEVFQAFGIIRLGPEEVAEGLSWMTRASLSFWDACIVAAANRANCSILFSEDMQANRTFGSTRIINPFQQ